MAFAVRSLPATSFVARKPAVGVGWSRRSVPALRFPNASTVSAPVRQSSVRCSAEEGEGEPGTSGQGEKRAQSELGDFVDHYGGWEPVEAEPERDWKAGAMRVGAGFVLAIGVSLASYAWYQKQGRRLLPASPPTQSQQTASSKASWQEPEYLDDEVATDKDVKKSNVEGSEEQVKHVNRDQDVQIESLQGTQKYGDQTPTKESKQKDFDQKKEDLGLPTSEPVAKNSSTRAEKKKSPGPLGRGGKVVVPAIVDRMQELALAALQALKVVEEGADAGVICTRRDYARWLIATSSTLSRSSANKVFPAMYIEDETELAFDDVLPDDPDFAYIQGLAEAGLIPSNLSHTDVGATGSVADYEFDGVVFGPDSPLTRQDLVSWKLALDRRPLPALDKEAFQAQSGFIDVDRIESRVWPAIIADLYSGDNSIIASAFGFTRRFQPHKAVTVGQAAIALASGDTSDQLAEELTRLEAERMAEEAVAADAAMEARAQKEVNALFNGELEREKQQREQTDNLFEEVKAELEKLKSERDSEKDSLLKDRAAIESEKELLQQLKQEVDEQLQELSLHRVEALNEKERLEKLRLKAEEDEERVSILKTEVDVEKKALMLARLWAEDEAQKARAQAKVLEAARKRWASRGIEVSVDKAFDEDSIPGPSWRYSGPKTELEKFLQRAPLQDVMARGEDLKSKVNHSVVQSWQAIGNVLKAFLQKIVDLLLLLRSKILQLQHDTFSSAGQRLKGTVSVASDSIRNLQGRVAGISSGAINGTKRFADGCRGEAEKFAQRFKHD